MPLPDFESMQARALDSMQTAQSVADPDVAQRYTADAQTHALLSIGAALHELAEAMKQRR